MKHKDMNFDIRKYLAEGKLYEAAMACPTATQNLELNTKNRDAAIKNIETLPLEVITGNSVTMLELLKKVVLNHNLHLIPSHSSNMGSYLITMTLYIK